METELEKQFDKPKDKNPGNNQEQLNFNLQQPEEDTTEEGEITNNDGSIIETLDTAFHNNPGYIKDHSIAGSNRADYYEARSQGKSDSDEETEYIKNQHSK